jgi:hypothetical protein
MVSATPHSDNCGETRSTLEKNGWDAFFHAYSMRPDDRQAFTTVGIKFELVRSGISFVNLMSNIGVSARQVAQVAAWRLSSQGLNDSYVGYNGWSAEGQSFANF